MLNSGIGSRNLMRAQQVQPLIHDACFDSVAIASSRRIMDRTVYPPQPRVPSRFPETRLRRSKNGAHPGGATNCKTAAGHKMRSQSRKNRRLHTAIKGYVPGGNRSFPRQTSNEAYLAAYSAGPNHVPLHKISSINQARSSQAHDSPYYNALNRHERAPNPYRPALDSYDSHREMSFPPSSNQGHHHQYGYSSTVNSSLHAWNNTQPIQKKQPNHRDHYNDDLFSPSPTSVVYVPFSPTFCDSSPNADFSQYVTSSHHGLGSLVREDQSLSPAIATDPGDASEIQRNMYMSSMKEAMTKALARNKLSRSKVIFTDCRGKSPEMTLNAMGATDVRQGGDGTGRLAYDPRQPQYSTLYDPDPFRNDSEYSPYFPGWND